MATIVLVMKRSEIILKNQLCSTLPSKLCKLCAIHDIIAGERNIAAIKAEMLHTLEPLHVEYVEILNRDFDTIETIEIGNSIILVCAKVGTTRLIDNLWI